MEFLDIEIKHTTCLLSSQLKLCQFVNHQLTNKTVYTTIVHCSLYYNEWASDTVLLYIPYTAMSGHVVHLQDDQKVPEELKCTYCKLVLNDPVETSESGLRFCKECYHKTDK